MGEYRTNPMAQAADAGLLDGNGRPIDKPADCVTENGRVKEMIVDGQKVKVKDTVTLLEVLVHKLEDGREVSQVLAMEFMMVDHKEYMVRQLTDAINTVMKAQSKRSSMIKMVSTAVGKKLGIIKRGK